MKVFNLFCAITLFLTTMACTNDDLESLSDIPDKVETKSITSNNVELATVVELLLSVDIDQTIMNEVKRGVEQSIILWT